MKQLVKQLDVNSILLMVHAVNVLSSQFDDTINDWIKVKRVFRYSKGTRTFGLRYFGKYEKSKETECCADASLGTNDGEGKSTSGYIIKVFGDVIS